VSREQVVQMFAEIDALDPRFVDRFQETGMFRMGNGDPVHGKEAIRAYATGFFGAVGGIRHQIENCWEAKDVVFANGAVTYVRKDGTTLTVPFAALSRFESGRISQQLTYVDASRLFSP
jgi:ketosteroid isomerase-like protein